MWLIAEYESVTLFSLKVSAATSSGGKTLLIPTPFAFKMALLDVAIRIFGIDQAEDAWAQIRGLDLGLLPAPQMVVSNLFQRILKPYRNPPAPEDPDFGTFQRTIGYREYAHITGVMKIALNISQEQQGWFITLLLNLNYLGKRGGFVQLVGAPKLVDDLPAGFVHLTRAEPTFDVFGTLQVLDDCAPEVPFDRMNIYALEKLKATDRIQRTIILPYRVMRASKSFTLYRRIDEC